MKEKVRVYTRDIDKDDYPFGLAKAVHFEVENEDDKGVRSTTALNNNYAVLFAEGNISKDNTIIPLGIDDPIIFELMAPYTYPEKGLIQMAIHMLLMKAGSGLLRLMT